MSLSTRSSKTTKTTTNMTKAIISPKKRTRTKNNNKNSDDAKISKFQEEDTIENIKSIIDSTQNNENVATTTTTSSSTSLTELLSQALSSNDKDLLEMCFSIMDMVKVRSSIRALPASKVLPLLKCLVTRIRSKAIRSQQLLQWIEALFHSQLSTLLMTPGLEGHFAELQSIIESRCKSYRRMLQLKGRLDLLLLQKQSNHNNDNDLFRAQTETPSIIFDEASSEDDHNLSSDHQSGDDMEDFSDSDQSQNSDSNQNQSEDDDEDLSEDDEDEESE